MSYKQKFIKRDHVDSNKIPTIKETYEHISKERGTPDKPRRKDEPFVLMFRNFIFFDVKSYECHKGDLYIRNVVDDIVLKRYFRMDSNDQLTVFKNRVEFDEFMNKVENDGYLLGPDEHVAFKKKPNKLSNLFSAASDNFVLENFKGFLDYETGKIDAIQSEWDGAVVYRNNAPDLFDEIVKVLEDNPDKAQIINKNDFM